MNLRFLVDAQLPPALADHLIAAGHDAEHVNRIGLGDATDAAIWKHASQTGRCLITKDEDFVLMVRRDPGGPPVVWVRLGNTTNRALWQAMEPVLEELFAALATGERLVEIG